MSHSALRGAAALRDALVAEASKTPDCRTSIDLRPDKPQLKVE